MKVRRQLQGMEEMILTPVKQLDGEDWHRAPDGKWSVAQIVDHVAIGVELVSGSFEKRAASNTMSRRATPKQSLLRHLVLAMGQIPRGRQSPEIALPGERPNPELVTASFRMGVERLATLATTWPEEKKVGIYVRHPLLGDLNLPEWIRFHFLHCRHHAAQIEDRLHWLKGSRVGSQADAGG